MNNKHREAVNKANKSITENSDKFSGGPYRLKYHFMPPIGWINDPNGLIKFNHEYHLFFQYHPFSAQWGPMHWGHAKSNDLVFWEYLPVALAPSESYDNGNSKIFGCFSGCAVIDNDRMVLVYTGHVEENNPKQVQCIAVSNDGIHFEKYEKNPVIDHFPEDGSYEFRDPNVWKHGDRWHMIVGSSKDGTGKVLIYTSYNLKQWSYEGVFIESDGSQGSVWECPNFFTIGNEHVLMVSPIYGKKNGKPVFIIGDVDYDIVKFRQKKWSIIDYGDDFYAPRIFENDDGRIIMMGWMNNWVAEKPTQINGWAGEMSVPREIIVEKGILKQIPIRELQKLRTNFVDYGAICVRDKITISKQYPLASETFVEIDMSQSTSKVFGLQLRGSEKEQECIEIAINLDEGEIYFKSNFSTSNQNRYSTAPLKIRDNGTISLKIFLDISSVEIFVNEGEVTITNRIYTEITNNYFKVFSKNGEVYINTIKSWTLLPIW